MSDDTRLGLAKQLVIALEQGDDASTDQLLDDIAGVRETQLFREVGKLTRQLHDALGSFAFDAKIASITENDIPDAKERLNYVISMTEQAANQTLTAVENLLTVSQQLDSEACILSGKWERFRAREMPYEEFKEMSQEITQHFKQADERLLEIQSGLNDILMAQSFQDITGQIIRKVIDLVKNLEDNMVGIIRVSSAKKVPNKDELLGPVVPGIDDKQNDVASDQVDVDDLLSSLGF